MKSAFPTPLSLAAVILLTLSSSPLFGTPPRAISDAQRELTARGFYKGAIDGVAGSQTAAAVRRFQIEQGLKVTGRLNKETFERLGIPPPPPASERAQGKNSPPPPS